MPVDLRTLLPADADVREIVGASAAVGLPFSDWVGSVSVDDEGAVHAVLGLPKGAHTLRLTPERAGPVGALQARNELEVGDRRIDDAFVIRGDDIAVLLLLRDELRAITADGVTLEVGAAQLSLDTGPLEPARRRAVLAAALSAWGKVASHRQMAQQG